MLIEHRTYTTRTEHTKAFVARYRDEGMAIQVPIFGPPIAFLQTEIGPVEDFILIWSFADFDDRQARRAELALRAEWGAFLRAVAPMVVAHHSRLMLPVELP